MNDELHETEWRAQEGAFRAERLRLPVNSRDTRARSYQAVIRVLRQAPPVNLPGDFAQRMAALAAHDRRVRPEGRIESMVIQILIGALAISVMVLAALKGRVWWGGLTALVPVHVMTNPMLLSLAVCAAITAFLGHWRRLSR